MKKSLNHGLVLKNVHRVIKFNQKPWLKPYIKVITELRKKTQNDFKNKFFKLIINPVFGKTLESLKKKKKKKNGIIKLVTSEKRRNYLVSEPNYLSIKSFTKNLLAIEMSKTQIFAQKTVYLNCMFLSCHVLVSE